MNRPPWPGTNRRTFLRALAAGLGLSPLISCRGFDGAATEVQVRPTLPSGRVLPLAGPSSSVLTPGDLVYLGGMKVPTEVGGFSAGAMTARKIDGVVRILICGNRTEYDPVLEFAEVAPSLDPDPARWERARLLTKWGDVYQGKRTSWNPDGSVRVGDGGWWTSGLHWHNGRLYWAYHTAYGVDGYNDWCLGLTDLKDDPAHMVSYGPWRLDDRVDALANSHAAGYMTEMPDGGIGIGAPIESGNASSSWGPNLRKILAVPSDSTPGGFRGRLILTAPEVAYDISPYPLNPNGVIPAGVTPHRFKRNQNYTWTDDGAGTGPDINPLRTPGNQGYWTQNDWSDAAVWVNLPDKQGLLCFGSLATGHVWYGEGTEFNGDPCSDGRGPNSEGHQHRWWIFDPADCARVAAGQANAWGLQPVYDFAPTSLARAGQLTLPCKHGVTGAWLDTATRTLYLCSPQADPERPANPYPLIHMFQIK